MTTGCQCYVFTTSTVPATGPRGARATLGPPAQRLFILRDRSIYTLPCRAWRHLLRGRAERSHPRSRAAVCATGAKGFDGEDLGRATIGLAMIGCDHAWAALVLVHRNAVPSIHMRCRITASLRATATLARLRPRRLATSSPQRLSAEKRVTRESNTFAAS
jgi:hypothetical protein